MEPNLRLTHPNLYRSLVVFSCVFVGLGLNFIFTNPTFNPYAIPKVITGSVFLVLGLAKIVFLGFLRNLRALRVAISLEIVWMVFWGIGTSVTFFQGKTSLQLFVLYMGFVMLELFVLIEPSRNPLSSKEAQK